MFCFQHTGRRRRRVGVRVALGLCLVLLYCRSSSVVAGPIVADKKQTLTSKTITKHNNQYQPHRFLQTVQSQREEPSVNGSVKEKLDEFPTPNLSCDPCIRRSDYRIKMITHGTDDEAFWWSVRAAALQAAKDMGIFLEFELYPIQDFSTRQMAQDIYEAAGLVAPPQSMTDQPLVVDEESAQSASAEAPSQWDALIVTIHDTRVQHAVQQVSKLIPTFAMNNGYDIAHQLGVLGYVGQDEYKAGEAAAMEFLRYYVQNPTLSTLTNGLQKALFINHAKGNPGLEARLQGYNDTLWERTRGAVTVQELVVSRSEVFDLVTQVNDAFRGCPYDVVLMAGSKPLDVALKAMENNHCGYSNTMNNQYNRTTATSTKETGRSMLLGVFDDSDDVLKAVAEGKLLFTISQQQYLQGVIPVLLASIYSTTNMKFILSDDNTNRVFESGPSIINRDNLPSDTLQVCTNDAFPVCPQTLIPDRSKVSACDCLDRSTIRIGGVLHGVKYNKFWDTIFSAAEGAADDMGVELDMVRFEQQDTFELLHAKMAARIKSLCESGVDGIFVSIPSDIVMEAVRDECLPLNIPVISVNAGAELSKELGLLHHVGMYEYEAGRAAGKRFASRGVRVCYCVNQQPGNYNVQQRCLGFEDAIAETDAVTYGGMIEAFYDNTVLSVQAVLDAVESDAPDWRDVGLLLAGQMTLPVAWEVQELHPGVSVGTFDVNEEATQALADGRLLWAIDQQSYLQGAWPVYLLSYQSHTQQALTNHAFQTGPSFVERPLSEEEEHCRANSFRSCPSRPPENFNYVSEGWKTAGYIFFGIIVFIALLSCGWMLAYKNKSPIVRASQPIFLTLIIVGALISSMALLPMSVETGYRYTLYDHSEANPKIVGADVACMAVWWLYGIGFSLIFSALFAKIYRVKMIIEAGMSFRKIIVHVKDVANVLILMMMVEGGILLSWQMVSPERWERSVLRESDDGFALESVGRCESDHGNYFKLALIVFHLLSLLYALILCFRTKHLDSDYAETSYISLAVIFMFQILVIAVPIYVMVEEDSNIYYFVRASVVFLQNFTVIGLIFFPKMLRVYKGKSIRLTKMQSRSNVTLKDFLSPIKLSVVPPNDGRGDDVSPCAKNCEEEEENNWMLCEACGHRLSCMSCGSAKLLHKNKNQKVVDKMDSNSVQEMLSPFGIDDSDLMPEESKKSE